MDLPSYLLVSPDDVVLVLVSHVGVVLVLIDGCIDHAHCDAVQKRVRSVDCCSEQAFRGMDRAVRSGYCSE